MEYKSIYDSVEAITYTGYNFSEVNEFCGGRLYWKSKTKEWDEKTPPGDLEIFFKNDEGGLFNFEDELLIPGQFVVRLSSGHYCIIEGYDFLRLFEAVEG